MVPILLALAISLSISLLTALLVRRYVRRVLGTPEVAARLREEVEGLVTELNGITERNVELAEDSLTKLRRALEKAGKAATVLEREIEKRDASRRVYTELGRRSGGRPANVAAPESPEAEGEARPLRDSAPDDESNRTAGRTVNLGEQTTDDTPDDRRGVRDRALALYREGKGVEEIAANLDLSRGEIELIISLHGNST